MAGRGFVFRYAGWLLVHAGRTRQLCRHGSIHKLGDRYSCGALNISLFSMGTSCVLSLIYAAISQPASLSSWHPRVPLIAPPLRGVRGSGSVALPTRPTIRPHRHQLAVDQSLRRSSHRIVRGGVPRAVELAEARRPVPGRDFASPAVVGRKQDQGKGDRSAREALPGPVAGVD